MAACYDAGGRGYVAHRDNDGARPSDRRQLSAILYLNQDWGPADGGALRCHVGVGSTEIMGTKVDVVPAEGTLVIFKARELLHEVRPAHRRRWALSVWFEQPAAADEAGSWRWPAAERWFKLAASEGQSGSLAGSRAERGRQCAAALAHKGAVAALERELADARVALAAAGATRCTAGEADAGLRDARLTGEAAAAGDTSGHALHRWRGRPWVGPMAAAAAAAVFCLSLRRKFFWDWLGCRRSRVRSLVQYGYLHVRRRFL